MNKKIMFLILLSFSFTASAKWERKDKASLKKILSPLEYEVTQKDGTEPPFKNKYWNNKDPGIYVDITTGEPLFASTDKFDSGTGWPSFTKPISEKSVILRRDHRMLFLRKEVRSSTGDSHLGHVFDDGPEDKGGKRYCINSAALKFIPLSQMKEAGYGDYLHLFSGQK